MPADNSFKNFDDFHLIDELVKFLLYELKIRNMEITKFSMMNMIFKIKNESVGVVNFIHVYLISGI